MPSIVESTLHNVRALLKSIYGNNAPNVNQVDNSFIITRGSAAVNVSVHELNEQECVVQALAYVVKGARISPELLAKLLHLNNTFPFGAFGLLSDDTITYSHRVAGAHLDKNELELAINWVAHVADESDDQIRAVAGGRRAVDADLSALFYNPPVKTVKAIDSTPKKAPVKKAPAKKAAPAPKKAAVKKAAPKKAVAKKAAPALKKAIVKKAVAKKPAPKKAAPKKIVPKKAAAKKR
jgi:hypothetical protein